MRGETGIVWYTRFLVSPGGPIGYLKLLPVGSDSAPLESRSDRSGSQQGPTSNRSDRSEAFVGPTLSRSTRSRGVDRARADRLHTLDAAAPKSHFRVGPVESEVEKAKKD